MSFRGFGEMPGETSYDTNFTTPAGHTGITFIAASGDNGVVEYPSSSPNVLSVGATTLSLGGLDSYGSETAWSGSGGGYSQYEPEPNFQESVQQTGMRSTPDVSFDSDPSSGVKVYSTPTRARAKGSWQIDRRRHQRGSARLGGNHCDRRSGSAPPQGLTSLDGPTQTLPSIYAASSANFNSVTVSPYGHGFSTWGFNPFGGHGSSLTYGLGLGSSNSPTTTAGATANTATGLGSPGIGPSLIWRPRHQHAHHALRRRLDTTPARDEARQETSRAPHPRDRPRPRPTRRNCTSSSPGKKKTAAEHEAAHHTKRSDQLTL